MEPKLAPKSMKNGFQEALNKKDEKWSEKSHAGVCRPSLKSIHPEPPGDQLTQSLTPLRALRARWRIYPLALRANPATVPGVKLVRLVKLVKLVTLSISNQTKIDQHRPQNRPKIVPKSTQNRPKIDQDRPKIELGWGLGAIWAPRWLREPT